MKFILVFFSNSERLQFTKSKFEIVFKKFKIIFPQIVNVFQSLLTHPEIHRQLILLPPLSCDGFHFHSNQQFQEVVDYMEMFRQNNSFKRFSHKTLWFEYYRKLPFEKHNCMSSKGNRRNMPERHSSTLFLSLF